jgi:hypothetical protein
MKKTTKRVLWIGGLAAGAVGVGAAVYYLSKPKPPSLAGTNVNLQMPPIANNASIPRGTSLTLLPPSGGKITAMAINGAPQPGPVIVGGQNAPVGSSPVLVNWTDANGAPGVGNFNLQVT